MKIKFFKIPFLKQILPRSLFARSLLILIVPIVLTMGITTYIFFDRHWDRMAERLATAVAGEVAFLADMTDERIIANQSSEGMSALFDQSKEHMYLDVRYVDGGKILPDPVQYVWRGDIIKKILSKELNEKLNKPYRILVDVEEKWIQIQVQLNEGALIITSPERRLFSSSGYVFLIWMIGVSTILMVVAILFMRNQIRPIKRLSIAADRFGKGRGVPFFKVEGAREVRQAARAFLGMRDRLDKQIQQRTAMLAGVSHDLRTPLTRMKLQLEMMQQSPDAEELKADVNDMQRMIDAYLQFARGDGGEETERVDLKALLDRLKQNYVRQNFKVNIETQGEMKGETKGDSFSLMARPVALERCLNNIISNAQKYAEESWVYMKLIKQDVVEEIEIIIEDNGAGIQQGNYEEVFKPFFREEKSRNTKKGGVGLGLPIAQDIILAHGGEISLSKSDKGGLKVQINLPV